MNFSESNIAFWAIHAILFAGRELSFVAQFSGLLFLSVVKKLTGILSAGAGKTLNSKRVRDYI